MALYCIGDIQGCHGAFERLLHLVDFSASRDTLYILGDLVNRGPHSAQVLRTCMRAGTMYCKRPIARPCCTGCASSHWRARIARPRAKPY